MTIEVAGYEAAVAPIQPRFVAAGPGQRARAGVPGQRARAGPEGRPGPHSLGLYRCKGMYWTGPMPIPGHLGGTVTMEEYVHGTDPCVSCSDMTRPMPRQALLGSTCSLSRCMYSTPNTLVLCARLPNGSAGIFSQALD
eukprot:224966-Amphidinium_carterae.1